MLSGWDYQDVAAAGTVLLALVAAFVASVLTGVPPALTTGTVLPVVLIVGVVSVALAPLYVSRPRSMATLLRRTGQQVGIACLALVALGAGGVVGAPAISTTFVASSLLLLALPPWYETCRSHTSRRRVLIVGDDPLLVKSAIQSLPIAPLGFLSPTLTERGIELATPEESASKETTDDEGPVVATDGGVPVSRRIDVIAGVERIGGLSRLEHALEEHDIDTVALAFTHGDREECFGALRTCRDHGVDALVHESLANRVLTDERVGDTLVGVDLEPWPWYSRAAKRAFDIVFAGVGVLVLAPVMICISVAIKLDSPGPVLYDQTRSSTLGGTFTVSKFRSMVTDAESDGAQLSEEDAGGVDPRVTDVGKVLRKTHLDEIPQLFAILTGEMSVVGPRPERPEIDREIAADGIDWSKRWFVKPGLTGIAQVNEITGFEPGEKLACDLEYIRRQSLWLDVKLVALQVWSVVDDVIDLASSRLSGDVDDRSSTK
jgi:lipopolysaccharide/colanic/teichoic acid biosynthesis glycosyltransferase